MLRFVCVHLLYGILAVRVYVPWKWSYVCGSTCASVCSPSPRTNSVGEPWGKESSPCPQSYYLPANLPYDQSDSESRLIRAKIWNRPLSTVPLLESRYPGQLGDCIALNSSIVYYSWSVGTNTMKGRDGEVLTWHVRACTVLKIVEDSLIATTIPIYILSFRKSLVYISGRRRVSGTGLMPYCQ